MGKRVITCTLLVLILVFTVLPLSLAEQDVYGVNVCGTHILCGQNDGICPEDFVDPLTGQAISCEGIRDIDCARGQISFLFSGPSTANWVSDFTNSQNASVNKIKESLEQGNYVATFTVEGPSASSSITTITFSSTITTPPAVVLFDNKALLRCDVSPAPCYTYEGSTLSIHHSLSLHVIQVMFKQYAAPYLPYFLLVVVLMLLPVLVIAVQRQQYIKDLNIYFDHLEHQVHMPHGSLHTLDRYIRKKVSAGKSRENIRNGLLKAGWEPHVIDLVMHRHHTPHEDVGRLKVFVYRMKKDGKSDEEIRELLASRGWKEEQLQEVLR